MENTIKKLLTEEKINYFIHSMAVSDYTVDYVTTAERLGKNIEMASNKSIVDLICNNQDIINENKNRKELIL